jgi:hypothetical protein
MRETIKSTEVNLDRGSMLRIGGYITEPTKLRAADFFDIIQAMPIPRELV